MSFFSIQTWNALIKNGRYEGLYSCFWGIAWVQSFFVWSSVSFLRNLFFIWVRINCMQSILLSGGSGKRLWPLSNNARSKQFLPLLEEEDGGMESMAQRVVRQVRLTNLIYDITLATNVSQQDIIVNQLDDSVKSCYRTQKTWHRSSYPRWNGLKGYLTNTTIPVE